MEKGFSLIEVITAIFILTVGVGGSFSLVYQTLSTVYDVRSRLTASFLAQEGVEIVKNLRDAAWLESRAATSTSWLTYLGEGEGDYELDYSTTDLTDRALGANDDPTYLRVDNDGFFNYSSGDVTHFTRKISLSSTTNTVDVIVLVNWEVGGRDHDLEIKETITNWYGK